MFGHVIALGEYKDELRKLVLRMKTDRQGVLALSAAKAFAVLRNTDFQEVKADYIIPVPMHRFRRWDRGVNSPDLIAEGLGRHLQIPVTQHLVRRILATDLQYTLSQRNRADNVRGAFALRTSSFWDIRRFLRNGPMNEADLAGKNILLVDDILTTGATCNEITKILLKSGVGSVSVAVLARAVGSDYRQERRTQVV